MLRLLSAVVWIGTASAAVGEVVVSFAEGAPKDAFSVANTGACAFGPLRVVIDLAPAEAGLYFDVSASGAGVEVFQPLEVITGDALLMVRPDVIDGDTRVALMIGALPPEATVAFTIDVDDSAAGRQTVVLGSEIAGAEVSVQSDSGAYRAQFDQRAEARLGVACP